MVREKRRESEGERKGASYYLTNTKSEKTLGSEWPRWRHPGSRREENNR